MQARPADRVPGDSDVDELKLALFNRRLGDCWKNAVQARSANRVPGDSDADELKLALFNNLPEQHN